MCYFQVTALYRNERIHFIVSASTEEEAANQVQHTYPDCTIENIVKFDQRNE
jgi:hypothetical protein